MRRGDTILDEGWDKMGELILLGTKGGPALRTPGPSFLPTSNYLGVKDRHIIVDCGIGVTQALARSGKSSSSITDVFITHFHSDHVLELGGLLHTAWTSGLNHQVRLYGPEGIESIWHHFLEMMAFDIRTRIVDEGRPDLKELVEVASFEEGLICRDSDIEVSALRNMHPPVTDSFALRFLVGDFRITFSGDTAYLPSLANFAERSDILVHEAMLEAGIRYIMKKTPNTDDRLYHHLTSSHTLAGDVGKIANDAKVKTLILNHLIPPERDIASERDWESEVKEQFSGAIIIGYDGLSVPFQKG